MPTPIHFYPIFLPVLLKPCGPTLLLYTASINLHYVWFPLRSHRLPGPKVKGCLLPSAAPAFTCPLLALVDRLLDSALPPSPFLGLTRLYWTRRSAGQPGWTQEDWEPCLVRRSHGNVWGRCVEPWKCSDIVGATLTIKYIPVLFWGFRLKLVYSFTVLILY